MWPFAGATRSAHCSIPPCPPRRYLSALQRRYAQPQAHDDARPRADPEPVFQMPFEAEKVEVVPAGVIVIDSGIARGVEKSALGESAALNSRRKPMNKTMRKKRWRPYSFTFDRLGKTSRSPELAAPLDTVCGHVKVQTNAAVVDMLSTTNEAHTVA